MVNDRNDPKSSDESTAPTSSELTAPYDTGELRQVNQFQAKQLLTQLGSAPLRLRSDNLVPRPWGGRRLLEYKSLLGATRPGRYGESFEVSAYPLDMEAARYPSFVEFDDGSSMRLSELIGRAGPSLLGPTFLQAYGACIPLLPKFLDIEGLLSVQSHPAGLPEAYVVIDCAPGATIRVGFAKAIDPEQTVARLQAASAVQARLHELFWTDESGYAPAFAELLGKPDAVRRLVERLTPMLRDQADRPRLHDAVATLDACHGELLEMLNVITVEPGMVILNSDALPSN
jgi:mannose-6-phosphate isomerase class I